LSNCLNPFIELIYHRPFLRAPSIQIHPWVSSDRAYNTKVRVYKYKIQAARFTRSLISNSVGRASLFTTRASTLPILTMRTHSGAISEARSLTQVAPSSFDIGVLKESQSLPRTVGRVNEIRCWPMEVEVLRMLNTATTSSILCNAAFRAISAFDGAAGRVDWWSCFARRRSRRVGLVPLDVSTGDFSLAASFLTVIPLLR